MTSEFVALPATATVADAVEAIRGLDEDFEAVYYVYTTDADGAIAGVLSLKTLIVAERTARLRDLAYKDVVWVAPDLDQEQVAEEMSKYALAAIPVCDENRHILGIVTVDDAMDVMAEEHAEDLQIAGVGSGETAAGEKTHAMTWFVQRQYWIVVWALFSLLMPGMLSSAADDSARLLFIYPMAAMPVVLLAASRMVSFVKNYFLEYDERDDEPKPYLGFWLQNTALGALLALVVYLCAQLVVTFALPEGGQGEWALAFMASFEAAAITVLASSCTAVIYLKALFWRDENDLNTSGTAMTLISVLVSAVFYTGLAWYLLFMACNL